MSQERQRRIERTTQNENENEKTKRKKSQKTPEVTKWQQHRLLCLEEVEF